MSTKTKSSINNNLNKQNHLIWCPMAPQRKFKIKMLLIRQEPWHCKRLGHPWPEAGPRTRWSNFTLFAFGKSSTEEFSCKFRTETKTKSHLLISYSIEQSQSVTSYNTTPHLTKDKEETKAEGERTATDATHCLFSCLESFSRYPETEAPSTGLKQAVFVLIGSVDIIKRHHHICKKWHSSSTNIICYWTRSNIYWAEVKNRSSRLYHR